MTSSRTAKATAARRAKLFQEWEKRLQRMGLGEQAGCDQHILVYGALYLSDSRPFNYGSPHEGFMRRNGKPFAQHCEAL
jgi:hypothetical protein